MPVSLQNMLQNLADGLTASLPRKRPDSITLKNCRIVSHRGEHDNIGIMENTLAAFDRAVDHGVWGIEFDVRWTKDLQPVVIHDSDCRRVFGSDVRINELSLAQILTEIPLVPDLRQVIQRYAGRAHLMIELKSETFTDITRQRETLAELLKNLKPAEDFHLLALDPEIFDVFNIVPNQAMLPVAEFNFKRLSRLAIENNYAGVSGQYLLIGQHLIRKHRHHGQKVGTGFARSRYCFYRELNREVEWVFTNHALKLHAIRQQLLQNPKSHRFGGFLG